jgi:hypothetical protein
MKWLKPYNIILLLNILYIIFFVILTNNYSLICPQLIGLF